MMRIWMAMIIIFIMMTKVAAIAGVDGVVGVVNTIPIYPKHFCKARSRNVPKNENPDQQAMFSVHTTIFDAKDGSM
jgi:hypothetical protein